MTEFGPDPLAQVANLQVSELRTLRAATHVTSQAMIKLRQTGPCQDEKRSRGVFIEQERYRMLLFVDAHVCDE